MGISFEGGVVESPYIDRLHEKAEEAIELSRIQESDFSKQYETAEIEADLLKVETLEESFRSKETTSNAEMKKIANIFEAIILEHGELSNWFGESAITMKTSKYDDYVNGVDIVVEFPEDDSLSSYLGLGVDVTFSANAPEKFLRIRGQIAHGRLAQVKYVDAGENDPNDELHNLPEVIVGVSKDTVLELARLWIDKENKELSTHRIQIMMLEQMKKQLETFYLDAMSYKNTDLAETFTERLVIVNGILADKTDIIKKAHMDSTYDAVHTSIMDYLDGWQRSITKIPL